MLAVRNFATRHTSYCCLGIAAKCFKWDGKYDMRESTQLNEGDGEALGLNVVYRSENPGGMTVMEYLTVLNDDIGLSFEQIARWVENHYQLNSRW